MNELEALKPDVKHQLEELNRRNRNQLTTWGQSRQDGSRNESFDWPSIKNYNTAQVWWSLILHKRWLNYLIDHCQSKNSLCFRVVCAHTHFLRCFACLYSILQADRMVARDSFYRSSNVQGGKMLTNSKSQFNKL